ncbi:MAG: Mini-ribonuclease 3 [Clostridia bacterium]|nr:Mini-ribonuclease 3 [Clostridia bacterium]
MDIFERSKEIQEVKMLSPLVWAYVGDSVYELFIRTHLVNHSNAKPHKLHLETIQFVKAEAQARILDRIWNKLREEEQDIFKRGRNTENHHLPKNGNVADYSHATGFEALIGYLYLTKQDERLEEILKLCIME